ncbi:hypothetical protein EJ03DRAFT_33673 [Teratosphaeria nubilosa]|uniref:Uncharacterized protein n=1 Tax=Teratosphaeria nubilosa TaxID=161662 RepID=A0A6G1KV73_9PEZI|nr:hypothetical protein EJ03DRAFT_33673 [Teratosphaeria nubilosa]
MSTNDAIFDPSRRAGLMEKRSDLNKPILRRLFPTATSAEHTPYISYLQAVVLAEVRETHGIATTKAGHRCGKDITDRSAIEALKLTKYLGSDTVANEHTLLMVAQMVVCKNAKLKHYEQASITARRWKREAFKAVTTVAANMAKAKPQSLGEASRVEEDEADDCKSESSVSDGWVYSNIRQ